MEFLKSARTVSMLTLMSRIFGLVRDMVTTSILPGIFCDALLLAWTVPNVFRNLFGEGALSSAFIPAFSRVMERDGVERAFLLARRVITCIALFLVCVVLVLIGLTYLLPETWLLYSFGYDAEKMALTLSYMRVLLPYLAVICVIAQCQGVLHNLKIFFLPALSPILLNAVWITAALLAYFIDFENDSSTGLFIAAGIMFGGLLQFLLFIWVLRQHGFPVKPAGGFHDQDFKTVMKTTVPMILGVSAVQLNVLADRWVASAFLENGVTHLYVGNRMMQFPFALIGLALSTALFPLVSRLTATGDREGVKENLRCALRISFFLSIPAAVGLLLIAEPTLVLFFQRGEFTPERTAASVAALRGYAAGIPFLITVMLLTRIFYAMGDWKRPLAVSLSLVVVNVGLDLVLVHYYAEAGIAAATSIAAIVQGIALALLLRKKIGRLGGLKVLRSMVKIGALTVLLGLTVWGALSLTGTGGSLIDKTVRVFFPVAAGLVVYLVPARAILKFEWKHLAEAMALRRSGK